MRRMESSDWPRLLTPAPGCLPPYSPPTGAERVLHVKLANSVNPGTAMSRALELLGRVATVEYRHFTPLRCQSVVLQAAHDICPTLVLIQLGRGGTFCTPEFVAHLRGLCHPTCRVVHWDCDEYHTGPRFPDRQWWVNLGRVCDISLIPQTRDQAEYAELGVKHPGYWQVGCDLSWSADATGARRAATPIVFMGSNMPLAGYSRRLDILRRVDDAWPGQLTVHGRGWRGSQIAHEGHLNERDEAGVLRSATAVLCMSMHRHISRYTSDRLWRTLGAGALAFIERFTDCEALGLGHMRNCVLWDDWEELHPLLASIMSGTGLGDAGVRASIRRGALELAMDHSWAARMGELQAMVDVTKGNA
jgi:hypothetical protein